MTSPIPRTVRTAAVLVALQGAVAVLAAAVLAVRGLAGADRHVVNGFGTAAWFVIVGVAVLGAGWALWSGRRWGRGLAVFTQLLILPVTWYAGVGSHRWPYAVPVALVAMVVLAMLFSPSAIRWLTGDGYSPASASSCGPETR